MISFPPTFRRILNKGRRKVGKMEVGERGQKSIILPQLHFQSIEDASHLVSGTTNPSSTQAILVTAAPIFTTQAVDIPAPYVVAKDS